MRIAIVDGYSTGATLAELLAERGAECVHVRSMPQIPETFRHHFSAGTYGIDLGYEPEPARVARRLAELRVDRVVAGAECGVVLADTLTNIMKLPGNSGVAIDARRDKALMADRVRDAGLRVPTGRAFRSAADAVSWFAGSGLPEVVAKPTRSAGTDNVHFCADADQLDAACRRILGAPSLFDEPNTEGIVQERLHGVEYYLNTVSHEGVHRVAEMWRSNKTQGANRAQIYDYEEPVDPCSPTGLNLRQFVYSVLDALGIRTGAAHTEVMLTPTGPVLIESGARLSGSSTPDIIERYFGVSQAGLLADALLDPARLLAFTEGGLVSSYTVRRLALINHAAGPASPHDWLAEIETLPSAIIAAAYTVPGEWLPATADQDSSPGYAYLASADAGAVLRDYRHLRAMERTNPYTTTA
jgi:biotin carboxylase